MKTILITAVALSLAGCLGDSHAVSYAPATHIKTPTLELLTSSVISDNDVASSSEPNRAKFTYFVVKNNNSTTNQLGEQFMTCILRNNKGELAGGISISAYAHHGGNMNFEAPDATPNGTLTCTTDN